MKLLYGICGSFCCHESSLKVLDELCSSGHSVTPILSKNASTLDTRFGTSSAMLDKVKKICGKQPVLTIPAVEKTVTGGDFDAMLLCPCTGNTAGKISAGITDDPVTMGVKAMLRNKKPIVIAFASNDGLAASFKNIAHLMDKKNVFFVPMRQDDYVNKPSSLVCDFSLSEKAISAALSGKQLQPVFLAPIKKEK